MRALRPGVKVLFATGYSEGVFDDDRRQPSDPVLRKPYRISQLSEALQRCLA